MSGSAEGASPNSSVSAPYDASWMFIRLLTMGLAILAAMTTFAWQEVDGEALVGMLTGLMLGLVIAWASNWHHYGQWQSALIGGGMLMLTWWLAMQLAVADFDLDAEPWFQDGLSGGELWNLISRHRELWFRPKFVFGVSSTMLLFTMLAGIWRLPRPTRKRHAKRRAEAAEPS